MIAPFASSACPVCGGDDIRLLTAAMGVRAYCGDCFHGWRVGATTYPYSNSAMCSLGTSEERLAMQIDFFAPFTPRGARILEIGCATGELAAATRRRLTPGWYEGIELSPAGARARAHLDRLHDAPLPDLLDADPTMEPFDVILMSHVLEHLADPARELAAMRRVLAPGGAIFVEVPNRGGNLSLPIDDNASHLHFFCATSLARLFAKAGLETIAIRTGARLDARYSDSVQIMARPFSPPQWRATLLSDSRQLEGEDHIVVWGAGSLAHELLANFFDVGRIDFFIDRDPGKIGSQCLGRPVRGADALLGEPRTILINSIDFADAIAGDVARLCPGIAHRLVRVGDLL